VTSSPRKNKSHYKIRLAKAIKAMHSEYMFRLMMAENNMLSLLVNRECLDLNKNLAEQINSGVRYFSLLLEYGFMVEHLIAFIENIPPEVQTYLRQFPNVAKLLTELQLLIADPRFAKLRTLRNSFIFHLDFKKNSKKTKDALALLLKASNQSKQVREEANLIIRPKTSDKIFQARYVIGDIFAHQCLLMELDIPRNIDIDKNRQFQKYRQFILDAHDKFVRFAEGAIICWIGSEKLYFDYSKY